MCCAMKKRLALYVTGGTELDYVTDCKLSVVFEMLQRLGQWVTLVYHLMEEPVSRLCCCWCGSLPVAADRHLVSNFISPNVAAFTFFFCFVDFEC